MTYPQRDNNFLQSRKKKKTLLSFALVLLTLLIVTRFFFQDAFSEAAHWVALPFWDVSQSVGNATGGWFSLATQKNLVDENKILRDELTAATSELANQKVLQARNAELEGLLGRKNESTSTLASVIISPPKSLYDTFVLDAGQNYGVAAGDQVRVGNVIIGTITRSLAKTSEAEFYSSPGVLTDVILRSGTSTTATSTKTVATGLGGGAFELRIPQGIKLSQDDFVTIPGTLPLIIGQVRNAEANKSDAFQTVYVTVPVNLFGLETVLIQHK